MLHCALMGLQSMPYKQAAQVHHGQLVALKDEFVAKMSTALSIIFCLTLFEAANPYSLMLGWGNACQM